MFGRIWTLFARHADQASDDYILTIPVTFRRTDVEALIRFGQTPTDEERERRFANINDLLAAARWLMATESKRQRMEGCEGLFFDPAWFIMLDLYIREGAELNTSVSSACIASGVPATTALRCLTMLAETGKIVRSADPRDQRRIFVSLSNDMHHAITTHLVQAFDLEAHRPVRATLPALD